MRIRLSRIAGGTLLAVLAGGGWVFAGVDLSLVKGPDGRWYETKPFTGIRTWFEEVEGASVKRQMEFHHGVLIREAQWHPGGRPWIERAHVVDTEGRATGRKETYWDPEGRKRQEEERVGDRLVRFHVWDPEGRLVVEESEGRLHDRGKPWTGTVTIPDGEGKPKSRLDYLQGELAKWTVFGTDGRKRYEMEYERGVLRKASGWEANGMPLAALRFREGASGDRQYTGVAVSRLAGGLLVEDWRGGRLVFEFTCQRYPRLAEFFEETDAVEGYTRRVEVKERETHPPVRTEVWTNREGVPFRESEWSLEGRKITEREFPERRPVRDVR